VTCDLVVGDAIRALFRRGDEESRERLRETFFIQSPLCFRYCQSDGGKHGGFKVTARAIFRGDFVGSGVARVGVRGANVNQRSANRRRTGAFGRDPGKGTAKLTYDPDTRSVTWTITFADLSGPATMAHFHGPAMAGQNAPPTIWLTKKDSMAESPIKGEATLTPNQAQDFADNAEGWCESRRYNCLEIRRLRRAARGSRRVRPV
jgi:hypothetical protein